MARSALPAESACAAAGTLPRLATFTSAPVRVPSFTFAPVTALAFNCCVPTVLLPRWVAATAPAPPTAKKTATVDITFE